MKLPLEIEVILSREKFYEPLIGYQSQYRYTVYYVDIRRDFRVADEND